MHAKFNTSIAYFLENLIIIITDLMNFTRIVANIYAFIGITKCVRFQKITLHNFPNAIDTRSRNNFKINL